LKEEDTQELKKKIEYVNFVIKKRMKMSLIFSLDVRITIL
jgi:hypothetical protein